MAEGEEQVINMGRILQNKSKIIPMIVVGAAIICVIIGYFIFKPTPPVKPPEQKKQVILVNPTLAPLTINEKPSADMFMDVKNQLIKAFE